MSDNARESGGRSGEGEPGRLVMLVLYFCFLASGVAGLIYEVLWAKYLALFVGSTGLAQMIVLATFMGGLALGSHVLGRAADRAKDSLKFYAFLELGIGLYAVLFSKIFIVGRLAFVGIVKATGLTEGSLVLSKIIACVICILLPTFLMGGTLPALSRYIIRSLKTVGPRISRLYFLNSLGAVAGCLLAGFYLIRTFGLEFSMVLGGILNITVGVVSYIVALRTKPSAPEKQALKADEKNSSPGLTSSSAWVVLVCVSLSGAVSMMYEVSWIRLLSLALGSSTYSFSIMLATFIFGLSIGGLLLSKRRKTTGYGLIFGVCEVCVGLTVLLSIPLYVRLPFYFNQVASCLSRDPSTFGLYQFAKFMLCASVMIVPTIFQGITLPAAVQVLTREMNGFGGRVGRIFAVNTLGTLLGVVFAGCVGLPVLGIKGTLELAIALNCLLGLAILVVAMPGQGRRLALVGSIAVIAVVSGWYMTRMEGWNKEMLQSGVYRTRTRVPSYQALQDRVKERKTVFYKDGIDATIAVQDIAGSDPHRVLVVNGKVDASTSKDLATQKMIAHLPLLLSKKKANVLIVGVGSGATIGSVIAHDVERIDVVELSGDIIDASQYFEDINGRYWDDKRVHVYREDAKTFLQVTDRKYDIIISEPTNPWIAGIAGVFSREYFEDCQRRLLPGGLFVQWIQAYELEDSTFFMMLETFSGVFPYYSMWNSARSDTILVGSAEPYGPDFKLMKQRMANERVREDFDIIGVKSLLPVLGMQMTDKTSVRSDITWTGAQHSDMFPVLEYVAPRGFYIGAHANGAKWVDERAWSPSNSGLWIVDYVEKNPPALDELENCYAYFNVYGGLFKSARLTWAMKIAESDNDATSSERVYSLRSGGAVNPARLVADTAARTGLESSLKAACLKAFTDYKTSRSCLVKGEAEQLLKAMNKLVSEKKLKQDSDILRWRGELLYDLARHDEAIASLSASLHIDPKANKKVLETGLVLCRSYLETGNADKASVVFEAYLGEMTYDIRVRLIRARISHAIQK